MITIAAVVLRVGLGEKSQLMQCYTSGYLLQKITNPSKQLPKQ